MLQRSETQLSVQREEWAVLAPLVITLMKKMKRLFRKWERLEDRARKKANPKHQENAFKIQKARILKSASATQRKLDKLGFKVG